MPEQLPDLARLADPGRPHQRHDLRLAAGHGAAERVDQHLRLVRAADQRALQAGRVGAGRARGCTTDHTGTGSALPFASSSGSCRKSIWKRVAR